MWASALIIMKRNLRAASDAANAGDFQRADQILQSISIFVTIAREGLAQEEQRRKALEEL